MAAINFPTATSNGQTFTADTGVIYTYVGTPPNGFWSGTFATQGLTTLDGRYIAKNDGNTRQTIQTQGLKFNNGTSDTILIDAVNGKIGVDTSSPRGHLHLNSNTATRLDLTNTATGTASSDGSTISIDGTTGALNIIQREEQPINFSTSNTLVAKIDSSGRVGIGETNPASLLHLSSASSPSLRLQDTTNNCTLLMYAQNSNVHIGTSSNHELFFDINGTQKMMITTGGNVGIGNTAPSAKLQIEGTSEQLKLTYTSIASYIHEVHNNGDYSVSKDSSERFRIKSAGQMVIGGTSALDSDKQLTLTTTSTSGGLGILSPNNGRGDIFFGDAADDNIGQIKYSHVNDSLTIRTNAADRFTIDSSGNVGIGTTSPDQLLHLKSTSSFLAISNSGDTGDSGILFRRTDNNQNRGYVLYDFTNDALKFRTSTNGAGERMRIDSSGNIGIGTTSPGGKLHVESAATTAGWQFRTDSVGLSNESGFYRDASDNYELVLRNGSGGLSFLKNNGGASTANLSFNVQGSQRMLINSSGNVGIGTSSPESALHARADGNDIKALLYLQNRNGGANSGVQIAFSNSTNDLSDNRFAYIRALNTGAGQNGNHLTFGTNQNGAESGPVERMRIDSPGRLLVGKDTSESILGFHAGAQFATTAGTASFVRNTADTGSPELVSAKSRGTSGTPAVVQDNDGLWLGRFAGYDGSSYVEAARISAIVNGTPGTNDMPGALIFSSTAAGASSPTERMRIDSLGNVLVGKTASNFANAGVEIRPSGEITLTRAGNLLTTRRVSSEGSHLSFVNISGSIVGSVVTTSTSTSFNTSSDYRLKENIALLTGAIPRIKLLPVKRFNFIGDDVTVDGFMAHEAAVVVPESVTGTHNEVDGDGNPVYQSIDQAKLVPLLTAALQEAISRIETLETEVAALKAA